MHQILQNFFKNLLQEIGSLLLCLCRKGTVLSDTTSKLYHTMNPETQKRIDGLLATDPNTVSPEVASAALAEFKKRRDEDALRTMVSRLNTVATYTNEAVEQLRDVRKQERKAKALVDTLGEAEDIYKTNGDWSAYQKTRTEAWNKFHACE